MKTEDEQRYVCTWAQREIVGGPVGLVDESSISKLLTRFRDDARASGRPDLASLPTNELELIIRDLVESADGVIE